MTLTRPLAVYLDLLRLDALRWTSTPNRPEAHLARGPALPLSARQGSAPACVGSYQRAERPEYPGASWGQP